MVFNLSPNSNFFKNINMIHNKKFRLLVISVFILFSTAAMAQETKKLYDPSLDGMKQIKEAIAEAGKQNKHVLIQYGGNWCPWCIRFHEFCKSDTSIMKIISDNYIPVKLNYDPTNKNLPSNEFLGNPIRFGFPVFIIIDGKGRVVHIQDSGLLEEGKGYSKEKVLGFFSNWTPQALIPEVKK
jgi:thiol:disulfide interchange protein